MNRSILLTIGGLLCVVVTAASDDTAQPAAKPIVQLRPTPRVQIKQNAGQHAGLPPAQAAAAMTVPEGFNVTLFAGEPDVHQPIALCLDDRGRLWVAEAYSYPVRLPDDKAHDRILIFEDNDGDGRFDKQTVFLENLNLVSGLEVGFGGVWIGAAPYFMFVPIKDGEDKPAGPPQILLDGWGYQDTHETLNSFIWGPDGWLYGCHGVFTHSRVGKPGTPDAQRVPINAGIWRYHPTRHAFEVFAEGTSNPWGLDFNDYGQAFCEACVIPHCFHIVQGARYHRQAGQHFSPHTYADIQTIADHLHWQGADPWAGRTQSDGLGGGHAHCGTMIYLGGAWPVEYRNQMFMGNIHGHRINQDLLNAKGSGYVASHGRDFLRANDSWARFINLRYGPDGNVFLLDWYDKQACHLVQPQVWDRTNGRIYKISYRDTTPAKTDLQRLANNELVGLQLHRNDWYVRHARRILQERMSNVAVNPTEDERLAVKTALRNIAFEHADDTRRLRGLWALHVTSGLDASDVLKALVDVSPHMRAWAIQLYFETHGLTDALEEKLIELARTDPSPVVRLYLASALQRLPLDRRWSNLKRLVAHQEDRDDHNLPLMVWYATEPLVAADMARALDLALDAKVSLAGFVTRRVVETGKPEGIALAVDRLDKCSDAGLQAAILNGMEQGLRGRRRVEAPATWLATFARLRNSEHEAVREKSLALAVTFGDASAMEVLRARLLDRSLSINLRRDAIAALLTARDPQLPAVLQQLIADRDLRSTALRGLARYDDPQSPAVVLNAYPTFNLQEKREAVATLASRTSYATALLEAVAARQVPANDLSADVVRQIRALGDPKLDERVAAVWGVVRETAADRKQAMQQYRALVNRMSQTPPDLPLGRAVYAKTCGQCHIMFGVGGKVGPDITGSNRANLDYLLENMLDPSAVIPKEYMATVFELADGRVLNGIVREENASAITVMTATETLTLARADIAQQRATQQSMMPEGQLKPLTDFEVFSLIKYLQNSVQVALPVGDGENKASGN